LKWLPSDIVALLLHKLWPSDAALLYCSDPLTLRRWGREALVWRLLSKSVTSHWEGKAGRAQAPLLEALKWSLRLHQLPPLLDVAQQRVQLANAQALGQIFRLPPDALGRPMAPSEPESALPSDLLHTLEALIDPRAAIHLHDEPLARAHRMERLAMQLFWVHEPDLLGHLVKALASLLETHALADTPLPVDLASFPLLALVVTSRRLGLGTWERADNLLANIENCLQSQLPVERCEVWVELALLHGAGSKAFTRIRDELDQTGPGLQGQAWRQWLDDVVALRRRCARALLVPPPAGLEPEHSAAVERVLEHFGPEPVDRVWKPSQVLALHALASLAEPLPPQVSPLTPDQRRGTVRALVGFIRHLHRVYGPEQRKASPQLLQSIPAPLLREAMSQLTPAEVQTLLLRFIEPSQALLDDALNKGSLPDGLYLRIVLAGLSSPGGHASVEGPAKPLLAKAMALYTRLPAHDRADIARAGLALPPDMVRRVVIDEALPKTDRLAVVEATRCLARNDAQLQWLDCLRGLLSAEIEDLSEIRRVVFMAQPASASAALVDAVLADLARPKPWSTPQEDAFVAFLNGAGREGGHDPQTLLLAWANHVRFVLSHWDGALLLTMLQAMATQVEKVSHLLSDEELLKIARAISAPPQTAPVRGKPLGQLRQRGAGPR
jgi:hypothetical protein